MTKKKVSRLVYETLQAQRNFWKEASDNKDIIIARLRAENEKLRAAITVASGALKP